ncbi:hypothetical protein OCUAc20_13460 [Acinetobacter baumannii]|nr:hypothetical protein OCUAc20_13460 [Acinetobacter baumannii]
MQLTRYVLLDAHLQKQLLELILDQIQKWKYWQTLAGSYKLGLLSRAKIGAYCNTKFVLAQIDI